MCAEVAQKSKVKAGEPTENQKTEEAINKRYDELHPARLAGKGKAFIEPGDRIEKLRQLILIDGVLNNIFSEKVNPKLEQTFNRRGLQIISVENLKDGVNDYFPGTKFEDPQKDYLVITGRNKNDSNIASGTAIFLTPKAFQSQKTLAAALIAGLHEANLPSHPSYGENIGLKIPSIKGSENQTDRSIRKDIGNFKEEAVLDGYSSGMTRDSIINLLKAKLQELDLEKKKRVEPVRISDPRRLA